MKLAEGPGREIRPTKAIVRKSLFQRLEPWDGKVVCDLYAGIGSLGLEALSRGARQATFVENNPLALKILAGNLKKLRADDQSSIVSMDVAAFLAATGEIFDVVLADPPYQQIAWSDLLPLVKDILAPGGFFAMELPIPASIPDDVDVRTFGKSKVCLWRAAA